MTIPFDLQTYAVAAAIVFGGYVVFGITEGTANPLIVERQQVQFREGENVVTCRLGRLPLPRGRFFAWVAVYWDGWPLLRWHPAGHIDVLGPDLTPLPPGIMRQSRIMVESSWEATADDHELASVHRSSSCRCRRPLSGCRPAPRPYACATPGKKRRAGRTNGVCT